MNMHINFKSPWIENMISQKGKYSLMTEKKINHSHK